MKRARFLLTATPPDRPTSSGAGSHAWSRGGKGSRLHRTTAILAVTVAIWALPAREGFAQHQDLDTLLGDQKGDAGSGAAATADVPAQAEPTSAPRSAEEGAAATKASEAPRRAVIEEIVVTAERREKQLHDVPISMSVLDSEFMRNQGVADLQDVGRYVPNVRIDFAGTQILPRIRGFGTNTTVTRGFELAVGLTIDEVPYGRQDYFPAGLFDVERVEVLRGPQGQLFGANTTVGLLNLATKDPTDELTGSINLELGELDRRRVEAAAGGPVLPGFLNIRVAGLLDEREGHVRNTTARIAPQADDFFASRDRKAARLKLDFPDLLGGGLTVSYQRDEFDFGATPRELTFTRQPFRDLVREFDPNADFVPLNYVGSQDHPGFLTADLDIIVARGRYDLADWGLNTVVGWSRLESENLDDPDATPIPALTSFVAELSEQTTFELRVTSPDLSGLFGIGSILGLPLGSTDFTSGFFFQRRTQSPTTGGAEVDVPLLLAIIAAGRAEEGGPPPPDLPTGPSGQTERGETRFEQESNQFSGFGQANWRLLDRWTILYGMRLDYTTKDASWVQTAEPDTAVLITSSFEEFAGDDSRDDVQFAPRVGMKFDWSDELNLYWNWSNNFQAGGFNNFGVPADPELRDFESSHVESWEVGTKMRLLGGTAELNLGLFWMTLDEFQLFTQEPRGTLNVATVINAGTLRARGVETDAIWLPTDWLTLRGAIGFNDTEFLDFPFGTCITGDENTDGDDDPRCDLTGGPLPQAPKWDISLTPSVRVPLTSIPGLGRILSSFPEGIDFTSGLTVQYVDTHFLRDTLDRRDRQPSFFLLDANVGFGNLGQGWSLQLRVENLTDEAYGNFSQEVPSSGGMYWKTPATPRLMVGQLRWDF